MRTLVWDVDDVLNNLAEHWLGQWLAEHPHVGLDYASLSKNPPHELLHISFETYLESLDLIRDSVDAHEKLTPTPQILEWLRQHGHRYRHLALTARPAHTAGPAAAWVLRHFGEWIRTVAFVPTRKPPAWPDYDLTKAGYLHWVNLDAILIDDSATNVMEVKAGGLNAVLFPQPWNPDATSLPDLLNQLAHF